jgi:PTH2 family peptidyl-tRNA hydrolase
MTFKQAIVVRSDLKMGKGKTASQCAHASVLAMEKAEDAAAEEWKAGGMKKICLKVASEKELIDVFNAAKRAKLPTALVRDAGYTQIEAGTLTAVGVGPASEEKIDAITGKLKLL